MKKTLLCAALLFVFNAPLLAADTPLDQRAQLLAVTEQRASAAIKEMDFYFEGELAKEINGQNNDAIVNSMKQAESLRQQAKQAFSENNYAAVIRFANNAIKHFHDSCQLLHPVSSPEQQAEQKEEKAYQRQLARAATLIDALKQAAKDANRTPEQVHLDNLQQQIDQTKQLAQDKKYTEARSQLDQVLLASRLSISALLSGSVLEAEKDTSPKGIYEYELFRNGTYRSLLNLLHAEGERVSFTKENFFKHNEKLGDELQQAAHALAAQQQYPEASKKLTESTSAYKYAVRRAGIVIPD